MLTEELIEMMIVERVNEILKMNKETHKASLEEQEKIFSSLDKNACEKLELLVGILVNKSSEDYQCIYREAFLDGLHLGHCAFGVNNIK